ncbi:MAG TPA: hypothetical protein PK191_11070 [Niabella sp.]|nr:hypothetical protein [Niabella sp.]HOZ97049.1 hypothetical protein [Niabella sp.]HQW15039.1 hypothetical protein [Niabella sp.]HQX20069.1 hypothetical protein [Niabella sp.]HQX40419.1 hypothetical protein [Niabella sp.]
MKNKFLLLIVSAVVLFTSSCKKSYTVDGGTSSAKVNMTTYDYLKSKPAFSDLVQLIDRKGLKDAINGETTFFATTNYGVRDYLKAMKNIRAIELNNENITYTLDSIPAWRLDSLKTYIFPGKLGREVLKQKGDYYTSNFGTMANVKYKLSLSRTYDYGYVGPVDFVRFTKVVGTDDADEINIDDIPIPLRDKSVRVQSSGIITNNGVVHVLDGFHRLFFNENSAN